MLLSFVAGAISMLVLLALIATTRSLLPRKRQEVGAGENSRERVAENVVAILNSGTRKREFIKPKKPFFAIWRK